MCCDKRAPGKTTRRCTPHVEDFVMRLNGKQTIYQMIQLAEEVRQRGGQPLDPLAYKHRYHDLLMARVRGRIEALAAGSRDAGGVDGPRQSCAFGTLEAARPYPLPRQRH